MPQRRGRRGCVPSSPHCLPITMRPRPQSFAAATLTEADKHCFPGWWGSSTADPELSRGLLFMVATRFSSAGLLTDDAMGFIGSLVQVYGQTEGGTLFACPRHDDPLRWETAGRALPGYDLRILHPDTMEVLPAGEIGVVIAQVGQRHPLAIGPARRELALDRLERRQRAELHVVFPAPGAEPLVGVDPRDDEHRDALVHAPLDVGFVRLEIENVELVDPRRHDQERPPELLLRERRVLDQLHELVLEHHLAGRDGEVLAHLVGLGSGGRQPARRMSHLGYLAPAWAVIALIGVYV